MVREANQKRANRFSAANSDGTSQSLADEDDRDGDRSHSSFASDTEENEPAYQAAKSSLNDAGLKAFRALAERMNRIEFK